MIGRGKVQYFANQAQKAETLGLYGVFGETNEVCEVLWRALHDYAETCDNVVINAPQCEVTFHNGAHVRIFCSSWRTYCGLSFDRVLFSIESIREHVTKQIKLRKPEPSQSKQLPTPIFGL